ncbi:MAG: hypothetical protein ACOCWH_04355, partial [Spirochaetota bacterium]
LSAEKEFEGLDEQLIISHSKRLTYIKDKTYITPLDGYTIRAADDCTIERIPLGQNGIPGFFKKQPARGIMLLAYLFRRTEFSYQGLQRFTKFYSNIAKLSDNLSLIFKDISGREIFSRLQEPIQTLYDTFTGNSGTVPGEIRPTFLFADNSAFLERSYPDDELSFSDYCDRELYQFLKRFLKLDKTVFAHVINGDPYIPNFIQEQIESILRDILNATFDLHRRSDERMDMVFGQKESVLSMLVDDGAINDLLASGRLSENFFRELVSNSEKIYSAYRDLTGIDPVHVYPGLESLRSYVESTLSSSTTAHYSDSESSQPAAAGLSGSMQMYSNSLQQILQFAELDSEFKQTFLKSLNEFKQLANPFTTDSDARKIRRKTATHYWKLYERCFKKAKTSKSIPPPVKLMFLYGFIDENLVEPDQIPVLHRYASDKYRPGVPIVYEYEFLTRIYAGKEETSVNEMGLTFDKLLREKARSTRNSSAILEKADDPAEKIRYEIENMVNSTTSVCSGSRSTAFPILTSHLVSGDPSSYIVTKSQVEQVFNEIRSMDYSLFYRETVLKIDDNREIIEEEILPYIILLPTYGTKTMMWQELTGTNKRSRARIVVPGLFVGDLKKELMHAFAVFRWELTRTLKGGLWADPVEGGITGAYSDYLQFFKKNSKLSAEARQKIAEKFRSSRNNVREMFAEDYILWLTYEREGIMKLNSVVRDIMYRFVPFPNGIRESLGRMPAFTDSATRFKNIRNRTFAAFERKFRKYKREDDSYPPEIEKYLEYLKM